MQWAAKHANPKGWRHLRLSLSSLVVDDALRQHLPPRSLICDALPASATEPSFSTACSGGS